MKLKQILPLAFILTPLAFAADDHDHGHDHGHDHKPKVDDHSKIQKGPNGGFVVKSKADFAFEVSVDKERKARIVFLDKEFKAAAVGEQTITGIAGERSAPVQLTFAKGKNADANVLISDKALPAGDHIAIILTITTAPDAKAVTERFELHLH
jgi:hypothetical protein